MECITHWTKYEAMCLYSYKLVTEWIKSLMTNGVIYTVEHISTNFLKLNFKNSVEWHWLIKLCRCQPWLVWLSWLEHHPITEKLQVRFPVCAFIGGNWSMLLSCIDVSLSPFLFLKAVKKCTRERIKKLYRFQVYNSVIHHLYIVLCVPWASFHYHLFLL